ncbi:hypothetical protein J6590_052207 [Homalodisca vitripennis]|nr:hypothetical protein J6590_052207 [Homalodisca vitripennis]
MKLSFWLSHTKSSHLHPQFKILLGSLKNPGGDAPWLQATGSGRRSRTSDLHPVTGPSERNTRKDLPCRIRERYSCLNCGRIFEEAKGSLNRIMTRLLASVEDHA